MSIDILYFSNHSGNTKRFVEKLGLNTIRIPINWNDSSAFTVSEDYVLCVPTYGGGSEKAAVPKQVVKFLNIPENRSRLRGVIGLGNINFGEHYCKAADVISKKTGVPVIARVEIFGTEDDIIRIKERLGLLYG
jgi:protein involved in ribonucleotide reduction